MPKTKKFKKSEYRLFGIAWSVIIAFCGHYFFDGLITFLFYISSIFLFTIAILKSQMLSFFYIRWMIIGGFIGELMSKVILTIIFFFLFTPISLFLKLLKKDLLNKSFDKKSTTYWNVRDSQPESMKFQF